MQRTFNKALRKPYFRNGSLGVDIAGGELWTPVALGNKLVAWWDPSDSTTVTIGTGVSALADKSGNNYTMSQATAGNQPTITAGGLNSLNVMNCSNDWLGTASGVSYRTLVVLAKWTDTAGDYLHIWDATCTAVCGYHGDLAGGTLVSATFADPIVVNGTKYVNGTLTAGNLARYTTWTIHILNNTGNISSKYTGYQEVFGPRAFKGDYAEMMYLSSSADITDFRLIEGYLAWKWGLVGSLPADHPYKNSPPTL